MSNLSNRKKRHFRIRKHLAGTAQCPRLAVFRSNAYIYAQIIDDSKGRTLAAESDVKLDKKVTKSEHAYEVGKNLAKKATAAGIKKVVFDRGGFLFHGRVERLAAGAREGGLEF